MPNRNLIRLIALIWLGGCGSSPEIATLKNLQGRTVELTEPRVNYPLNARQVRQHYREFLAIANSSSLYGEGYGEALRRLADLELQAGEESLSDNKTDEAQMQTAIRLYQVHLETYPNNPKNDLIMYQLAKAYEISGQLQMALTILDRIIHHYPHTRYHDEVQFRRGEMLFVLRRYGQADAAYHSIITNNKDSLFFEKALYKYGWTQFKQNRYKPALSTFFSLMDRKQQQGILHHDGPAPGLPRTEREVLDDTLHAISLAFAYQHNKYTITQYFNEHGARSYEPLIYGNLGKLHFKKERIKDAADTYMSFVKRYPANPLAPEFHTEAIKAYQAGHFISLILPAKEQFVKLYGIHSRFWQLQDEIGHQRIKPLLAMHIKELANHYHSTARKSKKPHDFQIAAKWYSTYLESFPKGTQAAQINFLLAECLFDGHLYQRAVEEYEKTAYGYPSHTKSSEAGYAALLSYAKIEKRFDKQKRFLWQQKAVISALRFSDRFPKDKRVPAVLSKTAEQLYAQGDHLRAASTTQKFLAIPGKKDPQLQRTVWIVLGHAEFELKNYAQAEKAYTHSLTLIPRKDKQYSAIYDRLGASLYKQGEVQRDLGNLALAVTYFLRIGKVTPASTLRPTAEYDAATALIQMKNYKHAIPILENFRRRYPKHKLQSGINEKLVLVYSETGQSVKAAREMEQLGLAKNADVVYKRKLLWQAATLYENGDQSTDAIRVYTRYIKQFPHPLEQAIEARHKLAEYAHKTNKPQQWSHWLQAIIKADAQGGKQRTERTQYLAANATLTLARSHYRVYQKARLRHPLKKSLKKKKRLMQNSIKAYQVAIQYRVAEVTTSATYQIAEIYNDFARTLMKSDRPKGLSMEEKEQYEILLEEQAYPFEEKAIAIHMENLKGMRDGIYDKWVKNSLKALSKLQPIRYAKHEKVDSYVETLH